MCFYVPFSIFAENKRIMGLIKTIRDLLGLSAIEQNQKDTAEILKQLKESMNKPMPAPAPITAQRVVPLSQNQQSSGEVEELRKQLEAAQQQVQDLTAKLVDAKAAAVQEYLDSAKEAILKASEPGAPGRPPIPGTNFNLKIRAHLFECLCRLKAVAPGFKTTAFINDAIEQRIVSFLNENPQYVPIIKDNEE